MELGKLIFGLFLIISSCTCFNPVQKKLQSSRLYNFVISKAVEYIFEFEAIETKYPSRISVSTDYANVSAPLMVVARQPRELLSFQLPLVLDSESGYKYFDNMSRTLCHNHAEEGNKLLVYHDTPVVTVSTTSKTDINFTISLDYQRDFYAETFKTYDFIISPSEPRYYMYRFPPDVKNRKNSSYDTVILEVDSGDDICMTVSIQNLTCPVFDSNKDISFRGFYETVGRQGAMIIPKNKFPHGFYIVFVAKADDYDCVKQTAMSASNRNKRISFKIRPNITYNDYLFAVLMTLAAIGAFYILFGGAYFLCSRKFHKPRNMKYIVSERNGVNQEQTLDSVDGATEQRPVTNEANPEQTVDSVDGAIEQRPVAMVAIVRRDTVDNISLQAAGFDIIEECDRDSDFRRGKAVVYLCDLSKKHPKEIMKSSYLYLYNVLTIAIFYGLPVIQLVITYQSVLNETGQQDLCFYNFLCAHPYGFISDFNHVFSNVGYVLFGVLFLIIVARRACTKKDMDFEKKYGIPQHYGLFYAMGVSLIVEGVLSASYHICPTTLNFQFDSSFMYVMAVLCCVKLYQTRHPDINATAYATFGVLAIAIVLGLLGILEGNIYFWSVFTVIHILSCFYLSAQIYYMGCWKLDRALVIRTYRVIVNDFWAGPINVIRPTYKGRMCLLVVGNLCNWTIAIYAVYYRKNFPLYLLGVFMMNTLLYFIFYVIMKIVHKERVHILPICFLILSVLFAVSALYCFKQKIMSRTRTPAQSRVFNRECTLLRFYDYHDIWHFLSAIGMFMLFMVLLTLDDDLTHTARSQIRVF